MMVTGRRHFSPLPSLPEHAVSRLKKKRKYPGGSYCFERLDLIFALIRHLILCLIVSRKLPSWSAVLVGSIP